MTRLILRRWSWSTAKVRQVVKWGYELVKHDFSTYDLLGKWGFEMGAEPTFAGWSLHDRSRTNAEVMLDLYEAIRKTAGEQTLLLGCNTVGHLGAGIFELQRTGDDTSGEHWERTRKMGVNTLAFRLAQNGTFFRTGCGLRRDHEGDSVGFESAVARCAGSQRDGVVYFAFSGRDGSRATKGNCGGVWHCGLRWNEGCSRRLDGDDDAGTVGTRRCWECGEAVQMVRAGWSISVCIVKGMEG